jgi:hypothetical protein
MLILFMSGQSNCQLGLTKVFAGEHLSPKNTQHVVCATVKVDFGAREARVRELEKGNEIHFPDHLPIKQNVT